MPRMMPLSDTMEVARTPGPGTFEFSAVRPEHLGATEYTLVTVVVDETGSVAGFSDQLLATVQSIVTACQHSPRADNLMVRLVSFNDRVTEVHGFKPLADLDPSAYPGFRPQGMTALYDAAYSAVGAALAYARRLADQDYDVNAAVYIITDGLDNRSATTPAMIADKIRAATQGEEIESLLTILVGLADPMVGGARQVENALKAFQRKASLDQYVGAGQATAETLARLAQFVSGSISRQSQALGTGAAAPSLTF
jgi:hypothetical protein